MHEAGHAVIAYRLDFELGPVTIAPDGSHLGVSNSEGEWMDGSRDEQAILVRYAGLAAERLIDPDARVEDGAMDDYERADELLKAGYVPKDMATLEREAADLVTQHRPEIEALAEALLEEETLDDDEQSAVIESSDQGEHWKESLASFRAMRARCFGR